MSLSVLSVDLSVQRRRMSGSPSPVKGPRRVAKGRKTRNTPSVATFRNFEREAELMTTEGAPPAKRLCLSDLFRPPVDILHRGTWESGREVARGADKWLLVNVQDNGDFRCQCLNRDVWSDAGVREILNRSFIMCQVSATTEEGEKFRAFYRADDLPHVAVLDPRTGGAVDTWPPELSGDDARDRLRDFLKMRARPSVELEAAKPPQSGTPDVLSEEEQMRLAIENSLRECEAEEATVRISLKLPDDTTEVLIWPESATIDRLRRHVRQHHSDPFRLICPATRCDLLNLAADTSLKGAHLSPSALVYVHPEE